ncbi:MAG: hypothetical protein IT422_23035 [Pirellulaceae bacterium]|nr:hypothetical protein [Pirellulaceae bacterium]
MLRVLGALAWSGDRSAWDPDGENQVGSASGGRYSLGRGSAANSHLLRSAVTRGTRYEPTMKQPATAIDHSGERSGMKGALRHAFLL